MNQKSEVIVGYFLPDGSYVRESKDAILSSSMSLDDWR